jgi:archaeal type IV pilus assembly protein PilA
MNVWEKNKRSWRKARKRAVSPIIATILLVAITVVLAAVLYVLISGLTHGPGNTPIGSAFAAGNPTASTCAVGNTYATNGCLAGHFVYTLTIESSTITFGSIEMQVKTSGGTILTAAAVGGFSIVNTAGVVVAQSVPAATIMSMTTTFTFPGGLVTSSTPLTNLYSVEIDMGSGNPAGQGYTFDGLGTGSYSGTTAALALP